MADFCSNSMGVPLYSSPNHLTTSSSAIGNYSRITLHSFNSAGSQTLLSENCDAPRAGDLVGQLLWNWTCHFTRRRNDSFFLFDPENLWIGPPEDSLEYVQEIVVEKKYF